MSPKPEINCAGRRVVVVLGMHNSGTSLVAQLVGTLGTPLGERVLTRASYSVDKPYDYWEHSIITELHEELLERLDRHWGTARGAAPIDDMVWDSALVAPFRRRLIEVVREELAAAPGPWAFKDPRTPRFLPLWRRIFAELGIEAVFVISTRPAGAVARSFANKAVVTLDWAEALWRRTYLEILAGTTGAPRLFIDYSAWFTDSAATVARLDEFLGAVGDRATALTLIDPGKLSDFSRHPYPASPQAQEVEALLRHAAAGQDVAAKVAIQLTAEDAVAAARSGMEYDCTARLGGRRVAIVTPELAGPFRNGGIGTAYAGLAEALAESGHAVTVLHTVTGAEQQSAVEDWAGHYAERGVTLTPLSLPGDVYAATLVVFEALRNQFFDVIHLPEWTALGFALVQAKRQGLAFRDTTLVCGTHGNYRWARLANGELLAHWWPLLWDHLERRSVEGAAVVISPSRYLMDWMLGQGWALPTRRFVQPNVYPGIQTATTTGAPFPPPRELVFFGRLEERKGLLVFLDALERLAARRPLPPLTFLGRSTMVRGRNGAEILAERAERAGWSYTLIEEFGRDEALAYLREEGRLAVVPSLLENSPFTVLECVVEGIPLLASDVGGVAELLRPEDAGMLFAATPDALADRLSEVLDHGVPRAQPRLDIAANRKLWQIWHRRMPPASAPELVTATDWTLWLEPGAKALPDAARLAEAGATAGAAAAWGIAEDADGHRWLGLDGPESLLALHPVTARGALALSPAAVALLAERGIAADQPQALGRAVLALKGAGLGLAAVPLAVAWLPTLAGITQPLEPARVEEALMLLRLDSVAQDLARLAALPPPPPPPPPDNSPQAPENLGTFMRKLVRRLVR